MKLIKLLLTLTIILPTLNIRAQGEVKTASKIILGIGSLAASAYCAYKGFKAYEKCYLLRQDEVGDMARGAAKVGAKVASVLDDAGINISEIGSMFRQKQEKPSLIKQGLYALGVNKKTLNSNLGNYTINTALDTLQQAWPMLKWAGAGLACAATGVWSLISAGKSIK